MLNYMPLFASYNLLLNIIFFLFDPPIVNCFWKCFAGWGTNEGLIISILSHRNAAQRKAIRKVYAETYGEDLLKSLDKELSSDFEVRLYLFHL